MRDLLQSERNRDQKHSEDRGDLHEAEKGCPITQIYLELGQPPARYDIYKLRLFFLKYILDQEEESTIYKCFNLQLLHPTKGDWASTTKRDLKHLNINLSIDEIKKISVNRFKSLVRVKCQEAAYNYLMNKRGSKGSEIIYSQVEMSEYLLPNNEFSIEDKRKLFSIRIRCIKFHQIFAQQIIIHLNVSSKKLKIWNIFMFAKV